MDAFPEYQRPDVLKMLRYVLGKKESGACSQVMLYTNNQGPPQWSKSICEYFDTKVGASLFDQVIAAFKVRGRRVEPGRTTHDKTLNDLLSCTKLPKETQICFLDDQDHPRMERDNVYYIHIKPYVRTMTFGRAAARLHDRGLTHLLTPTQKRLLTDEITGLGVLFPQDDVDSAEFELEVDKVVGKRILHHLQSFFRQNGVRFSRRLDTRRRRRGTRKR
jgi:hypothetical protein